MAFSNLFTTNDRSERLARSHGIRKRISRRTSGWRMVLEQHQSIHQRAETPTVVIRYRHIEHSVRGIRSVAWIYGTEKILHREVGKTKHFAQSSHLFQQTGFAILPDPRNFVRKTSPSGGRNEHDRNRVRSAISPSYNNVQMLPASSS